MTKTQSRPMRHLFFRWVLTSFVAVLAVGCGGTDIQQVSGQQGQPGGGGGGGGGPTFAISAPGVVNNAVALDVGEMLQFKSGTANQSVAGQLVLAQGSTPEVQWTSSNPNVASINDKGLLTAKSGGQADVSASVNGQRSSNVIRVTVRGAEVTLSSIQIAASPANTSNIAIGSSVTFTATGKFSDGTSSNITNSVVWSSSNTSVGAAPTSAGLFTALSAGSTNIAAARNGKTSNAVVVTVAANAPTLESITLEPAPTVEVIKGETTTFVATGHYSDDSEEDITADVTWESTDESVGLPPNADGQFTALTDTGSTEISASLDGVFSAATVVTAVEPPTPDSIEIQVEPVDFVEFGKTATFKAIGKYPDNVERDLTGYVAWSSSDEAVGLAPSAEGVFTPLDFGFTDIGASLDGVVATALTYEVTPVIDAIVLISDPATTPPGPPPAPQEEVLYLTSGGTAQFRAVAQFVGGGTRIVTQYVVWTSSDPTAGLAPVWTSGDWADFTALAAGTTDISATLRGDQTSIAIRVSVAAAP